MVWMKIRRPNPIKSLPAVLVVVLVLALAVSIPAASSSFFSIGVGGYASSPGPPGWTDAHHAAGIPDGWCAVANSARADLDVVEFQLDVPDTAVIVGIQVRVKASRSHTGRPLEAQLLNHGYPVGRTKAWIPQHGTDCTDTEAALLGGPNDLWGAPWSAEDVRSATFGVRISSGTGPGTRWADAVEVQVFYDLPIQSCEVDLFGSLTFSPENSSRVQDPGFRGSVPTERVLFRVVTSMETCTFTLRYTPFESALGGLPTTLRYSFGALQDAELADSSDVVMLQAPHGESTGHFYLTVLRDGHRNPAMLYWATVTVLCMSL